MKSIKNGPNFIRRNNVKQILELLRYEPLANLELAQKIDISATAINKILKYLNQLKIIEIVPENLTSNSVGRKFIRYRISSKAGLMVLLDLTQLVNIMQIKNYDGTLIFKKKYSLKGHKHDAIYEDDVKAIIKDIKKIQKELDLPVFSISISSPGQFDDISNEFILSKKFDSIPGDKFYQMFYKAFKCKVIIKNNVHMMAIGEYKHGKLKSDYNTALYVYVGYGLAACAIYKGDIISGWRGYAGEIGYNRFSVNQYLSFVSVQASINEFKEYLEHDDFDSLLKAYSSNTIVKTKINLGALALAENIINISNIIGNDVVVISGEVLAYGEEYFKVISDYINEYSIPKIKLLTSNTPNISFLGCEELSYRYIDENILDLV